MAGHTADGGPLHPSFADPAFEPQPTFDFDDANPDHLRSMPQNLSMLNGLGGPNPYLGMVNAFGDVGPQGNMFEHPMQPEDWAGRPSSTFPADTPQDDHAMDPSDMWDMPQKRVRGSVDGHGVPFPNSSQSEIIKGRGATVSESYGNLTPPDDTSVEADAPARSKPMLNRSERARNAALQRHAKTKKSRKQKKDKKSETESDESGDDDGVEFKRERYREKNRAAAAKCRAKKKTHVGQVESDARTLETDNTILKAKVRELRNQHSELRNLALQHNAAVQNCHCGAIHQYNLSKAAEITSSFSRFGALPSRANQDGVASTVTSPTGFGSNCGHNSYAATDMGFGGVNSPESMQMQLGEDTFPNFMQDPEGRSSLP